jgi:hypothetical protein
MALQHEWLTTQRQRGRVILRFVWHCVQVTRSFLLLGPRWVWLQSHEWAWFSGLFLGGFGIAGTKVADWTIKYVFPAPDDDPKKVAETDPKEVDDLWGISVSDVSTNVRSNIKQTPTFKKEEGKLHEQAYLKEDEQKRLYDILKEIKKLKDLTPKLDQTSFGQAKYRYKTETITYSGSDSAISWKYWFENNDNQDVGHGNSDPFSINQLSKDSKAVLLRLNHDIELSVDDACNRGLAAPSTP